MRKAAEHPRNCSLPGTYVGEKSFFQLIVGAPSRLVAATLLLMLAPCLTSLILGPKGPPDTGVASAAGQTTEPAAEDAADDEDDLDSADDGSGRLNDLVKTFNLDAAVPLTSAEEEALLGNWGDDNSEDED